MPCHLHLLTRPADRQAVRCEGGSIDRFGPPEVINVDDIPRPEPGVGQVLVQARAAGVGGRARSSENMSVVSQSLPLTLGSDISDVVDDALGEDGQLRDSVWFNKPGIGLEGEGYIDEAFRWAHKADTNAEVFCNDYDVKDERHNVKSDAMYKPLKNMLARGVPIHGVACNSTSASSPNRYRPQVWQPISNGLRAWGWKSI